MASATNSVAVNFPVPTGPWTAPTHYAIWDSASAGTRLSGDQLTGTPAAPATDNVVRFAATELTISLTGGDLTNSGQIAALNGFLAGTRYISLHTAAPSASNELTGGGYARAPIAFSDWTIT